MAMVLISSELEEVVEGSDTIVVLRDGAVVGRLSADEVSQDGVLGLIAAAARESEDPPANGEVVEGVATELDGHVGD